MRWWRRWQQRRRPIDEICSKCHRELLVGGAWELIEHFPPSEADTMFGGGTFATSYWCRRHRPAGARRVDVNSVRAS